MAVYGRSLYGTSTYGRDGRTADLPTLSALAASRTSVRLSWPPTGVGGAPSFAPVSAVALVRSLWGTPTNITAGQELGRWDYDVPGYTDTAVTPGARYYYSLFLLGLQGWSLASAASLLFPRQRDRSALFDLAVPGIYHRSPLPITEADAPKTSPLSAFLDVIAFGMDQVHTAIDESVHVGDAYTIEEAALGQVGASLGVDVNTTNAPRPARTLAATSAVAAQRGTLTALAASATAVTGWQVQAIAPPNLVADVTLTGNRRLGVGPYNYLAGTVFPAWSSTLNYAPGAIVAYNGQQWQNTGPSSLLGPTPGVGDVGQQWQPYTLAPTLAAGSYVSAQRTATSNGSGVGALVTGDQGSVSVVNDASAPAPAVITWVRTATTKTAGSATTSTTTQWQSLTSVALSDNTLPVTRWGTPTPAVGDGALLAASFYTNNAGLFPAVYGFTASRQLLRVLSSLAVQRQQQALAVNSAAVAGLVDPRENATPSTWSTVGGTWSSEALGNSALLHPPADPVTGPQFLFSAISGSPSSISATISGAPLTRMGLVFLYKDATTYCYATGAKLVSRVNNVETTLASYTVDDGQRLTATYAKIGAELSLSVSADGVSRVTANIDGSPFTAYLAGLMYR